VTERELAGVLLTALATSDLERVGELTAEDVVVFGTDSGERWESRKALLEALEPMRELGLAARWADDVRGGPGWIAGTAIYSFPDGSRLATRVSLVFAGGRLVHGHFSVSPPGE
jgi:SnoaL-like domain